jgi:prepilin-type N-terminal cleavage/methylation domain-containing protein
MNIRPPDRRRRGMTLVEIIVAMAILGFAMIGTLGFFVQALNMYHYDGGKLLVNRDIRALTSEMTDNATYANYFLIFPGYTNLSRSVNVQIDPEDPTQGFTTAIVDTSVNDGVSGDCLVLVYQDPNDNAKVARLVGYFRSPSNPLDPASEGPVRKFDIAISPSSTEPVWKLMPTIVDPGAYGEVIELSRGLADGKLFYNFYDRSVIVKGEIIHRGSLIRRATNTYNFTISPRG